MASNPKSRPILSRILVALLPLMVAAFLTGCASPRSTTTSFRIGDTIVRARITQHGKPMPAMINVHDDENTSVAAGKTVLRQSGGRLIELVHSGKRHLTFQLDGKTYSFDPNRIFTDAGIRTTLTRQGNYSEAAHHAVKQFADELLERFGLNREHVILALHNTGGGGLSINSYQPDRELSTAATAVHSSSRHPAGDFFYVTDPRFFAYLKERDFNVTLQDNANVPDDGSLSVYFASRGIAYANIEAGMDQLDAQIEMIRVAVAMLGEFNLLNPR